MNVEIGTEAAQFPGNEYMIFVAVVQIRANTVRTSLIRNTALKKHSYSFWIQSGSVLIWL
jgi:hypothetical protein